MLNVGIGASVAFASRSLDETGGRLWRSPALWSLVLLEAFVLLPLAAYLAYRYPDWAFAYALEGMPSLGIAGSLTGAFLLVGVAGFLIVRRLLARSRAALGVGVLAVGLLGAPLLAFFLRDALLRVGSTAAFSTRSPTLRPLFDTALGYLLVGAALVLLAGWTTTLWRLMLTARAGRAHHTGPWKTVKRPAGAGGTLLSAATAARRK